MGQRHSSWQPAEAEKQVRPQQQSKATAGKNVRPPTQKKEEKSWLQPPPAGLTSRKSSKQEQPRKAAPAEHTASKKKQSFHAYPSKDNLVLTVSLDAITRIG